MPVKILVFGGSIRTGSLSAKLASLAAKEVALLDTEVTHISLADYPLPLYDGDLEAQKGVPENAAKLARLMAAHTGVFVATPEYNHSLPPLLKNTIDWVSRPKNAPGVSFRGRVFAIGSTSNGMIGGARALIDLRKVLATAFNAVVVAEQVSISRAQDAFDEAGQLKDAAPAETLRTVAARLVDLARRLHG
ncbi:MAG: NAD(P)H-dependent oxidoreductase [Bauldia sp.]